MVTTYIEQTGLKWPLLIDSDQSVYRAYQMDKLSTWNLYNPKLIAGYLKIMLKGHLPGRPGKDWSQAGGDILVAPDGTVKLHHVSKNPHDRPSVDDLLTIIRAENES